VFNNNNILKLGFGHPFFKHEDLIDFPLRGKILDLLQSMYLEVLGFFNVFFMYQNVYFGG
jgi:hypothetical protein